MEPSLSTGQGIAVAGVWLAVASLPFAVLIFPLVVPVAAAWGGFVATRLLLGRRPAEPVGDIGAVRGRDDS